jgi:beta-lactamase class A
MLTRKVPFYVLIAAIVASSGISYLVLSAGYKKNTSIAAYTNTSSQSQCSYNIKRLTGFELIHPLMFAEPECESSALLPVKSNIEEIIASGTSSGVLTSASVYLRKFNGGDWISVGDENKYAPGSLLKVPMLIAFCRMKEKKPGLFDEKITYNKKIIVDRLLNYPSRHIELGKTYSVKELFQYMITYSDNEATMLLKQNMDKQVFDKVFSDMGLDAPNSGKGPYAITARKYSDFLKILYNASYLTQTDSEFCLDLLCTCEFKDGLVSGLPKDCKVAHKFGESGAAENPDLSESGIIFTEKGTYILTVMTKGNDAKKLAGVIGQISKVVFEKLYNANV